MDAASLDALRPLSAAIFGNTKLAEVVLTLADIGTATATEVSKATGAPYTMVRDVLVRLENACVVVSLRSSGPRSPRLYSPAEGRRWAAVCLLAGVLRDEAEAAADTADAQAESHVDA